MPSSAAPADAASKLLPCVADRYRPLVAVAGGTGLRWGELAGLRWDAVDLDAGRLSVIRVAVEVAGHVTAKPYPKTKAGRRVVPIAPFALQLLNEHAQRYKSDDFGHVFTTRSAALCGEGISARAYGGQHWCVPACSARSVSSRTGPGWQQERALRARSGRRG